MSTNIFSGNAVLNWLYDSLNSGISDAQIKHTIDHIAELGYRGITFSTLVHVDATGNFVDLKADSIDRVWPFLDYAQSLGLVIDSKIHWSPPENGNWNQYNTPSTFDIHSFLVNQAQPYLLDFAKVAQSHGVASICLGSESDNFVTQPYRGDWADIISSVKTVFSGELTWDAIYFGTDEQPLNGVAIWDLLDKIGLSFYPKVSARPTYDVDRIVALFNYKTINDVTGGSSQVFGPVPSIVEDLKALSQEYGKEILLGEVNYQPIADNLLGFVSEFDLISRNVPMDYKAQDVAYQALTRLIDNELKGVVTGGYFFNYDVWPYGFSYSFPVFGVWKDFSLYGTPAEVTLSSFIKEFNNNTSLNPVVSGSENNETLMGTTKDELFYGFEGDDTINGGAGVDKVIYHGIGSNFIVNKIDNGYTVQDDYGNAGIDLVQNCEYLSFDDSLVALFPLIQGTNERDRLQGSVNDDRILGMGGNDSIIGLAGNDTIDGGIGNDTMIGGLGDDTYYVDSVKDKITEKANEGNDTVISTVSYTLSNYVESFTLSGSSGIHAVGNALNNVITGNSANNSVNGGLGNDTLTGGDGNDTFVFNTKLSVANIDTITDFSSGDKIALAGSIFSKLKGDKDLSDNFKNTASDKNDYLIYDSNTGTLYYDKDGNGKGAAIQVAIIGSDTHAILSASDFVIV